MAEITDPRCSQSCANNHPLETHQQVVNRFNPHPDFLYPVTFNGLQ